MGGDHLPAGAQELGDQRVPAAGRGAVLRDSRSLSSSPLRVGPVRAHRGGGRRRRYGPAGRRPSSRAASAALVRVASTASRPWNSHPVRTGSPATASWASASSQPRSPLSGRGSQATVRCGRSPRIWPTSRVSTEPGPASTKIRAPASYMASIWSTKPTGAPIWAASSARTASASVPYGVGRAVGPDRELGCVDGLWFSAVGEPLSGAGDQRAVEGAGDGDALRAEPGGAQQPYGLVDRFRRSRDHRLLGRVVVGDDDRGGRARRRAGRPSTSSAPADDGRHGARVVAVGRARGGEDRGGALGAQRQERLRVQGAGGAEGDEFAVAVSGGHVGAYARRGEQGVGGEAGDAQGRLGDAGVGERGVLAVAGGVVEGGGRVERGRRGRGRVPGSAGARGRRRTASASIPGRWLPWPGKRKATWPGAPGRSARGGCLRADRAPPPVPAAAVRRALPRPSPRPPPARVRGGRRSGARRRARGRAAARRTARPGPPSVRPRWRAGPPRGRPRGT